MNNRRVDVDDRVSTRNVVGTAADLFHDITGLAELQGRLFVADLKSTGSRAVLPVGLTIAGLCMLLGLVPVLLLGVAELLVEKAELTKPMALLVSAGCGAVFGAVSVVLGWRSLRKSFEALANSRHELKRNLAWIKQALRNVRSTSNNS